MKHKTLALSVVIPVYNEEENIGACLDAIAAQSEMPDEVIVVDNNSTDGSVEIIKRYPFVTLLHEKRQGLRFTRDTGMKKATSDLLGRIDADSVLSPNWVETAKRIFTDDPTASAASGPCYYHDMPAKKLGLALDNSVRRALFRFDEPMLFGSNMVLRRAVWQDIVGKLCTEGEFFEDHDITIHLREEGYKIVYDTDLFVGVSARRLDDDPKTFKDGMSLHTKTFEMHGLKSPAASAGKYVYLTVYPPMKLLRKAYDADTNRLSFKKALNKDTTPRPNANT